MSNEGSEAEGCDSLMARRLSDPTGGWWRLVSLCWLRPERSFLVLVVLVYLALAVVYNATNPIFEAPDEIWHYLYVRSLALGQGLPRQHRETSALLAQQEAAQPPLYYVSAAALTFWAPHRDVAVLAVGNPSASLGDLRTDGNKNHFLHPIDQRFPWRGEVLTIHLTRFVSTLWGVLTIVLTYAIGRALSGSTAPALAAAMTVGFSPQFIFISSSVNNDVAVAATAALFVWLVVQATRHPLSFRRSGVLGFAAALVILAKPIAAGCIPLVAVGLWIAGRRGKSPLSSVAANLGVAAAVAGLSAGWWLVYNRLTYGSAVPLQTFLGRQNLFDQVPTPQQVLDDLTGLRMSYWAVFGWFSILAPPTYYRLFDALMILAAVGLGLLLLRAIVQPVFLGPTSRALEQNHAPSTGDRDAPDLVNSSTPPSRVLPIVGSNPKVTEDLSAESKQSVDLVGAGLVAFWVLSVFAGVFAYRIVVAAFQGRLAFGASGGIALLLALGWSALAPRKLSALLAPGLALTLLVPAAAIPWTVLKPAYAPPPVVQPADAHPKHTLNLRLGDEVRLIGADIDPGNGGLRPGDDVQVTLYFQGLKPMSQNYTLFLKLVDPTNRVLAGVDTYPGRGAWPTSFWEPGTVVMDRYHLQVPGDAPVPNVDHIIVGMYLRPSMEQLPVFDDTGKRVGDTIVLERIAVRNQPDPERVRGGVIFGNAITLLDHTLKSTTVQPGGAVSGQLVFGGLAPPGRDYTIFVHLEGPQGLIAQDDAQPMRGAFPTTFWIRGDVVRHDFRLVLPPNTAPGEYRLVAGWYDPQTGQRLATPNGDAVQIETIRVGSAR